MFSLARKILGLPHLKWSCNKSGVGHPSGKLPNSSQPKSQTIMYWIPRLKFSLSQNYVLNFTTKWDFLLFLTHAIKNYVLTFTTKCEIFFSQLFMEFTTSQFQFTSKKIETLPKNVYQYKTSKKCLSI